MNQVRDLLLGLTKIRPVLWWGFWVSSAVFIGISIGKRWPEAFIGASIIGEYFSTIATAYLGGFVFWYIVDHWEKSQSTERLKKFVIKDLKWIFNRTWHITKVYDEVHEYCSIVPKKHLMDSSVTEIARKLYYLYLLERKLDDNDKRPFRWAVAAWWVQGMQFKDALDHLVSNFRDFDLTLTSNIEALHHNLPTKTTIDNLIEYKEGEKLHLSLGMGMTPARVREAMDGNVEVLLYGFADQVVSYCQGINALIPLYERLTGQSATDPHSDLSLLVHREKAEEPVQA